MKNKMTLLIISTIILFLIPLLGIPIVKAATNIGWLDVQPLGSGTASYRDVAGGSGQYVYAVQTGSDNYAFMIISLANPASPSIVGYVDRVGSDTIHSVAVNPAETIAVVGVTQGIYVINISDKTNPNRTSDFSFGSNAAYDVELVGNLVYCAAGSTGLPVIDISDIYNPTLQFSGDYGDTGTLFCWGVEYDSSNNVIYGALSSGYFRVFSLDGSGNPSTQSTILACSTKADTIALIGTNLVAMMDDYASISIINTQNLGTPTVVGTVDIGGASGYYGEITYDSSMGSRLVAVEDDSLCVVDFTNPAAPTATAAASSGLSGYGVAVAGAYVIVAGGPWGFFVYRVSDMPGGTFTIPVPGFSFVYIISLMIVIGLAIGIIRKRNYHLS
ncbi:MAG: hypothetical protein ACTSPY_12395 [Candidatus Helarchaeota archaeon]